MVYYKYEKTLKEATDYLTAKIYEKLREDYIGKNVKIALKTNTKDTKDKKYYAVWGTSLSKGDIGAVGRGNRQQGFISGIRPSTNEAFSGKNPNHFSGVVYQNLAENIAKAIYNNTGIKNIVYIMANNGDRLKKPQSIDVFLEKKVSKDRIKEIIEIELENIEQNRFLFISCLILLLGRRLVASCTFLSEREGTGRIQNGGWRTATLSLVVQYNQSEIRKTTFGDVVAGMGLHQQRNGEIVCRKGGSRSGFRQVARHDSPSR